MTAWLNKDDPAPKPKPPAQGSTARQAVTGQERQEPIAAPLPAGKSIEARVAEIAGARNPLYEAARRLLRALAEIPAKMEERGEVERLRALLEQELRDFQAICDRLNIDRKHTTAAHYALCTALDEAVSHTEWGGGNADSLGAWPGSALASTFHQDRQGGTKVFQILGRLVESVPENIGTIEVYYLILSLGFQGRYRGLADGGLQLRTLRGRLLDMLNKHYGPVPKELSPHCEPAPPGRFHHLRGVPVWMSWVLAALVLAGLAGWYKYQLLLKEHDLTQQIAAIGNLTPPPAPKALRLAELLKDEIARGVVAVKDDDRRSTVVFRGDAVFGAGQAEINATLMPALNKVASEINKVEGKVQVIGHSDNQPIKSARFPSNQALSEERAAMVSEYLAGNGVAKGRLEAIGKGDSEPITDNQTPAARAANRRVEVVVTR
ncbi:type VI secretion system protein TssL, long form [Cupriavidus sp. SK-4]|uniref:type VI secretion system protein TssL, long form n=1 Tax=Cupriavidus sp. SK-4 TaxID=574750 RepID=UPI00055E2319|nr:type VI secretion system protein TssL, long form [Cupriavidus sp. SK-4]